MIETSNPKSVHPPLGRYSHTVKVPADAEWLVISGQVGISAKGKVASGIAGQCEQAFRNVLSCLKAHGMTKRDLVKFTVLITDPRFVADYRAARSEVIGDDVVPASTLMVVAGLASPELLVEVEALAAKS